MNFKLLLALFVVGFAVAEARRPFGRRPPPPPESAEDDERISPQPESEDNEQQRPPLGRRPFGYGRRPFGLGLFSRPVFPDAPVNETEVVPQIPAEEAVNEADIENKGLNFSAEDDVIQSGELPPSVFPFGRRPQGPPPSEDDVAVESRGFGFDNSIEAGEGLFGGLSRSSFRRRPGQQSSEEFDFSSRRQKHQLADDSSELIFI